MAIYKSSEPTSEPPKRRSGMPKFIDLREFILNGCQPELPTVADVGIGTGMLYAGRINETFKQRGVFVVAGDPV